MTVTESGKLSPSLGHVLSDVVLSLVASLTTENISLAQQSERIGLGCFLALTFVSGTKLEAAQYAGMDLSSVQLGCCSASCFSRKDSAAHQRLLGGQRALCGDGDSHWSGAGNGEDVMLARASHCQGVVNSE